MKIKVYPDIHGSEKWIDVRWQEEEDMFADLISEADAHVFLGDYVDSYYASDDQILRNLERVIRFKKTYPDRVHLLLGNHDIQYLWPRFSPMSSNIFLCSGHRPSMALSLGDIFSQGNHFNIAHEVVSGERLRFLFTHAGVTKFWWEYSKPSFVSRMGEGLSISEYLNGALQSVSLLHTLSDVSRHRGGTALRGSPLWADIRESSTDPLPGYHQIVGHTRIFGDVDEYSYGDDTSITFIDRLKEREGKYYAYKIVV